VPYTSEPVLAIDAQGNAVAAWEIGYGYEKGIVQAAGCDAAGPLMDELSIPSTGTVGQPLSFSVSPLDVWSARSATDWAFGDGASANGTSLSHTYATPGTYTVTVTSADVLGNATSASGTVVIAGAAQMPAPEISSARREHGSCAPPTKALRRAHAKRCTRVLATAEITRLNQQTGADSIPFSGRVGHRALGPGAYTATLTATNAAGSSKPVALDGEFAWVLEVLSGGQLEEWGKTEHSTKRRTAMPSLLQEDRCGPARADENTQFA
jgi:hypothetical protein